jgi:NAD+ kinase
MPNTYRHLALIGRSNTAGLGASLMEIGQWLRSKGAQVSVESETAENLGVTGLPILSLDAIGGVVDAAIVVGGDGTMLGAARVLAPLDVPLIGINHGRLGFMTDVPLSAWQTALESLLGGQCSAERRAMLDASVMRDGVCVFHAPALNDVVVARGALGGMIEFVVRIDGRVIYQQRADGLIIATPTGSTAYALSANGPILHPSLPALTLVPVAPQTLSNRPIVIPDHVHLEIELVDARADGSMRGVAHCDMQSYSELSPDDVVHVRNGRHALTLLHPPGYDYFATLRQKLHWNLMPA